jgi:hypothetical protein
MLVKACFSGSSADAELKTSCAGPVARIHLCELGHYDSSIELGPEKDGAKVCDPQRLVAGLRMQAALSPTAFMPTAAAPAESRMAAR